RIYHRVLVVHTWHKVGGANGLFFDFEKSVESHSLITPSRLRVDVMCLSAWSRLGWPWFTILGFELLPNLAGISGSHRPQVVGSRPDRQNSRIVQRRSAVLALGRYNEWDNR